jgi:hypothetical protein
MTEVQDSNQGMRPDFKALIENAMSSRPQMMEETGRENRLGAASTIIPEPGNFMYAGEITPATPDFNFPLYIGEDIVYKVFVTPSTGNVIVTATNPDGTPNGNQDTNTYTLAFDVAELQTFYFTIFGDSMNMLLLNTSTASLMEFGNCSNIAQIDGIDLQTSAVPSFIILTSDAEFTSTFASGVTNSFTAQNFLLSVTTPAARGIPPPFLFCGGPSVFSWQSIVIMSVLGGVALILLIFVILLATKTIVPA